MIEELESTEYYECPFCGWRISPQKLYLAMQNYECPICRIKTLSEFKSIKKEE